MFTKISYVWHLLYKLLRLPPVGSEKWSHQQILYQLAKVCSKIWRVPWMTHGRILRHLLVGQSIVTQLLNIFLSFYFGVVHRDNMYVIICWSLCRYSNINVTSNLRLLLSELNSNGDYLIMPFIIEENIMWCIWLNAQ
jgi:hypothetical protein